MGQFTSPGLSRIESVTEKRIACLIFPLKISSKHKTDQVSIWNIKEMTIFLLISFFFFFLTGNLFFVDSLVTQLTFQLENNTHSRPLPSQEAVSLKTDFDPVNFYFKSK